MKRLFRKAVSLAKNSIPLTPSQSATLGVLENNPDGSKFFFQADTWRNGQLYLAGQLKPKYQKMVNKMANHKLGTSKGKKVQDCREKRPEQELLGQYWLEHTPQEFTGEEPRYTQHEMRRLLANLSPEQKARVEKLNTRRPGPPSLSTRTTEADQDRAAAL